MFLIGAVAALVPVCLGGLGDGLEIHSKQFRGVEDPTAGMLCLILRFLLWCRLLCQAQGLYSSVVERQSCKLKVLGSIPSGG